MIQHSSVVNSFLSKHFCCLCYLLPAIGNPFPALSSSAFLISASPVGVLSISVFLSQAAFVPSLPLPEPAAGEQQGHIWVHVVFGEVREEWRLRGRDGFSESGRKDEGGSRALQPGLFGQRRTEAGLEAGFGIPVPAGAWKLAVAVVEMCLWMSQVFHEVSPDGGPENE